MEGLIRTFHYYLENTDVSFIRYLHDTIEWDSRLISILGSRGVGKTTLLLQHIKQYDNIDEVLYVSADDLYFSNHKIYDLALELVRNGKKKLYIDEIHKYKNWSQEIKNIYDQMPNLQTIYCKAPRVPYVVGSGLRTQVSTIYVPEGVVEDYQSANGWSNFADVIVGHNFYGPWNANLTNYYEKREIDNMFSELLTRLGLSE